LLISLFLDSPLLCSCLLDSFNSTQLNSIQFSSFDFMIEKYSFHSFSIAFQFLPVVFESSTSSITTELWEIDHSLFGTPRHIPLLDLNFKISWSTIKSITIWLFKKSASVTDFARDLIAGQDMTMIDHSGEEWVNRIHSRISHVVEQEYLPEQAWTSKFLGELKVGHCYILLWYQVLNKINEIVWFSEQWNFDDFVIDHEIMHLNHNVLKISKVKDQLVRNVLSSNSSSLDWKWEWDSNKSFMIIVIITQLSFLFLFPFLFLFRFLDFNGFDWILDKWNLDDDSRKNNEFEIRNSKFGRWIMDNEWWAIDNE
jgi:hypothetical protein